MKWFFFFISQIKKTKTTVLIIKKTFTLDNDREKATFQCEVICSIEDLPRPFLLLDSHIFAPLFQCSDLYLHTFWATTEHLKWVQSFMCVMKFTPERQILECEHYQIQNRNDAIKGKSKHWTNTDQITVKNGPTKFMFSLCNTAFVSGGDKQSSRHFVRECFYW